MGRPMEGEFLEHAENKGVEGVIRVLASGVIRRSTETLRDKLSAAAPDIVPPSGRELVAHVFADVCTPLPFVQDLRVFLNGLRGNLVGKCSNVVNRVHDL